MIQTALVFKTFPLAGWPLWHSRYTYYTGHGLNFHSGRFLAREWAIFERSLHLKEVHHTLVAMRDSSPGVTTSTAAAQIQLIPLEPPPFPRDADNPLPYNAHVRARKFPVAGRNSNQMWRGCLNEADVMRYEDGTVGLITRDWFTQVLNATGFQRAGHPLEGWLIERGASTIPVGITEPVAQVVCGGLTFLNGARRWEAEKISAGVQVYRRTHDAALQYLILANEMYDKWVTLDIEDKFPLAVRDLALVAVNAAMLVGVRVQEFTGDADPAEPGLQSPVYRYMATGGEEEAAAARLVKVAGDFMGALIQMEPYAFMGGLYWYKMDVLKMWDMVEGLNTLAARCLFFDWQNPRQGTDRTSRQGGYVPLWPELPPP